MKVIKQLAIILGFFYAGEALTLITGLPIPGSVTGMVLLLAALISGKVRVEMLQETADFFLGNLTLLFIPAVIGLMNSYELLKAHVLAILVIVFAGTIFTIVVTGLVVQALIQRRP